MGCFRVTFLLSVDIADRADFLMRKKLAGLKRRPTCEKIDKIEQQSFRLALKSKKMRKNGGEFDWPQAAIGYMEFARTAGCREFQLEFNEGKGWRAYEIAPPVKIGRYATK